MEGPLLTGKEDVIAIDDEEVRVAKDEEERARITSSTSIAKSMGI